MPDLTRVIDVLTPDRWVKYQTEQTAAQSAIRQSGIIETLSGLDISGGGKTFNMPFWLDIDGDDEVWASGHTTVPDPIKAEREIAVVLTRIKSWGAEDLAGMFAGDDPLTVIGRLVGTYWSRKEQKTLLSILKGIFANALTGNELDASGETISDTMTVDALNMLGDRSDRLTAIIMHSATRTDLFKKKLINTKPTEAGSSDKPEFETFLGRRVIVDDGAPYEDIGGNRVYTSFLFGQGAIGHVEGSPKVPVAIAREERESQEILVNRRQFIFHPRGLAWIGNAANTTPSNAELENGANWKREFELKNIPIVALKHQIG